MSEAEGWLQLIIIVCHALTLAVSLQHCRYCMCICVVGYIGTMGWNTVSDIMHRAQLYCFLSSSIYTSTCFTSWPTVITCTQFQEACRRFLRLLHPTGELRDPQLYRVYQKYIKILLSSKNFGMQIRCTIKKYMYFDKIFFGRRKLDILEVLLLYGVEWKHKPLHLLRSENYSWSCSILCFR